MTTTTQTIVHLINLHIITNENLSEFFGNPERFLQSRGPFPSKEIVPELIPEGWQIVADVEPANFSRLKFHSMREAMNAAGRRDGRESFTAEEVIELASYRNAKLGLVDRKRVLAEQESIIFPPRDTYIVFPGTILLTDRGELVYPGINQAYDGSRNSFWKHFHYKCDGGYWVEAL